MDLLALAMLAIGWVVTAITARMLARHFRDPGMRPYAWAVLVIAAGLAASPTLLEASRRADFPVGEALMLWLAVFGFAALGVYFVLSIASAVLSPADRVGEGMRLAMARSLAFVAGALATAAACDLAARLQSPAGLRHVVSSWIVMGAFIALIVLPSALLAFRRFAGMRLPLYQPALMGTAYWALFLALAAIPVTGIGRSALALAALTLGPFSIALAGCALLRRL